MNTKISRLAVSGLVPLAVLSGLLICLAPPTHAAGRAPVAAPPARLYQAAISQTTVQILDEVQVPGVKRLGINVGSRSWWGASQFIKNVIDNPGFEAGVYGSVAHVAEGSSGQRIVQDFWETEWNNDQYGIGQPVDFWNGAEYEFVTGPAKGRSGTIADFAHEDNRYVFYLDQSVPVPERWNVMFVRKTWAGALGATEWGTPDLSTTRPGSPGRQSLHLAPPPDSWRSAYHAYLDSGWCDGDQTSGKFIIIEGNWHLEFWAKGGKAGDRLLVRFFRENEATFLEQTITFASADWQRYTFDFNVPPGADHPSDSYGPDDDHPLVGFGFYFLDNQSDDQAWIDDVALYNADDTNPTVFTDAYVNLLKDLQPGVLRDWSNQFGGTLDIQLAEPWARQTQGYRPHERTPGDYSYSLHEFLELCQEVDAEPWYIIPPTFSPADMSNLAEYLAAPADASHPYAQHRAALGQPAPWTEVFPIIHLEFGNELWGAASGGDPFMGASLLGGTNLGQVAHDRFALFMANPAYHAEDFDLIIGGQAGYPGRQGEIEENSSNHDTLALAPYFGVLEDGFASDEEIFYPLFARPFDDVDTGRVRQSWDFVQDAGQGTKLSIYELNFHTTDPSDGAPLDVRNDYVTGMGGGIALPLHMLMYLRELQMREQCAFSSLQYSFRMSNDEDIRLWGMLRDLVSQRKRPTWLGVEVANHAIQGDMLRTVQSGDNPAWHQAAGNGIETPLDVNYVQSFAFRDGQRHSVILFNLHLDQAQQVQLTFPGTPSAQATLYQLAPADIHADNEDAENVVIQTQPIDDFGNGYTLDLPAHSVTALTWEEPTLELSGTPGDEEIYLRWAVNVQIPPTATWRINYLSQTGTAAIPAPGLTSTVRAYTLTNLTNDVWYTITLTALLGNTPFLTDTVTVMPRAAPPTYLVYLPLVLKNSAQR